MQPPPCLLYVLDIWQFFSLLLSFIHKVLLTKLYMVFSKDIPWFWTVTKDAKNIFKKTTILLQNKDLQINKNKMV